MITTLSVLGIVLSLYFLLKYSKKLSIIESTVLIGLLLSFTVVLLGNFQLSAYSYMGYNILLLLATIGILITESRAKIKNNLFPLVIVIVWLLSVLVALLNLQYHFEVLFGKLLITVPLSIAIFARNKSYGQFTLFWIILYLIHLAIEAYNSYM